MSTSEAAGPSPADQVYEAGKKYQSVRQAAFIGVGAMVGAGIFALLGAPASASIVTLAGILVLSVALDYGWKRSHPSHPVPVQVNP